jgi:sulfur carrier protein ThiS
MEMNNQIYILLLPENKWLRTRTGSKIRDILRILNIDDPDEVAVVVNGKLIEDLEYVLKEDDDVKIIRQGIGG